MLLWSQLCGNTVAEKFGEDASDIDSSSVSCFAFLDRKEAQQIECIRGERRME